MDKPLIIPHEFPGLPGVKCAFTTRQGGISQSSWSSFNLSLDVGDDPEAVIANRESLRRSLGFRDWLELRQVHGVRTVFDHTPTPLHGPGIAEADGSATNRPGLALVVKTADCQPILLAHSAGRHVMALHSGWRGNRQDYPRLAVLEFCARYSLDPGDLHAVIGPSLGRTASEFRNFELEWGDDFLPYFDPADMTMDLRRLSHDQLQTAGVRPEHIASVDLCTHERQDLFFSFRRDRDCGRQVSLIWIES